MPSILALGLTVVFLLTAVHLLFALIKQKVLLAGQLIERDSSPIAYWLWLAFDVFVLVFCSLIFLRLIGEAAP